MTPKEEQLAAAQVELEKYDWSVKTPIFDLALACINRDFDNILELGKLAYKAGLTYSDAKTFMVFKEAREIDGFLNCFPKNPLMIETKPPDQPE